MDRVNRPLLEETFDRKKSKNTACNNISTLHENSKGKAHFGTDLPSLVFTEDLL